MIGISIVFVVCCNGLIYFLKMLEDDDIKDFLIEMFGNLFLIYIVVLFYNFEILEELIYLGVDVNMKIKDEK